MKQIFFLCVWLISISTIAVDIHGDYTIGLGGIPASFDDSIQEGETKEGSSYINNVYKRDGFFPQAHLVNGNGVYPDILNTEGVITNGCTLTIQDWIDYTPQGNEADVKVASGTSKTIFIGQGTESENPNKFPVKSAFKGYLDSCRPLFSIDEANVTSNTIANPENYVSIDSSGLLTVNLSGLNLNEGETADISIPVYASNGYGTGTSTVNVTIATAVLTVNLALDGTPLHGGAQGTAEVLIEMPSETGKITWVGKSKDFIIGDRTADINFEAVSDGVVFGFLDYTGDVEEINASFSTSFNELAGDGETTSATVTANFKALNQIRVKAWVNGPGYIDPTSTQIESGESVTISALEANSTMWFWEITDGDETSYVDVKGNPLNGREEFSITITPTYNTNVVAYFGSIKDPDQEPPDPPEEPDDPPEDEDEEREKKKPKDPETGGPTWPPLPDFDDFDPGDLPDLGDLDDFTLDDYIHIMLEWDTDDYPPDEWLERLENIIDILGNFEWGDIEVFVEGAQNNLNNSVTGGGGGTGSNGGTETPFIFTTGSAGTSVYTTGDNSKESNAGLGAAALGGVMFFQMQQEVYKPYWSKNKPTKTAPVRPE